jgi:hypothetical protein
MWNGRVVDAKLLPLCRPSLARRRYRVAHCVVVRKTSAMEPTYFEATFSKSGVGQNETFTVYIELRDEDKALMGRALNVELKTRLLVERVGILELLPSGLNDDWLRSGRILGHDIKGAWDVGIGPTIVKRRNVWIIEGE